MAAKEEFIKSIQQLQVGETGKLRLPKVRKAGLKGLEAFVRGEEGAMGLCVVAEWNRLTPDSHSAPYGGRSQEVRFHHRFDGECLLRTEQHEAPNVRRKGLAAGQSP